MRNSNCSKNAIEIAIAQCTSVYAIHIYGRFRCRVQAHKTMHIQAHFFPFRRAIGFFSRTVLLSAMATKKYYAVHVIVTHRREREIRPSWCRRKNSKKVLSFHKWNWTNLGFYYSKVEPISHIHTQMHDSKWDRSNSSNSCIHNMHFKWEKSNSQQIWIESQRNNNNNEKMVIDL